MKISLLLLLSTFMCVKAQQIPAFAHDSTAYNRIPAALEGYFSNDYEAIISYAVKCSYPKQANYFVLGRRENKWAVQKISIKTIGRYTDDKDTVIINKPSRVSKKRVNRILIFLELKGFWLMDNDSLNWNSRTTVNGITTMLMSDGCSDDFEIFSNGKYKRVYSYMAEEYQKDIPVKQRQDFILCKDYFIKVMKIRN